MEGPSSHSQPFDRKDTEQAPQGHTAESEQSRALAKSKEYEALGLSLAWLLDFAGLAATSTRSDENSLYRQASTHTSTRSSNII